MDYIFTQIEHGNSTIILPSTAPSTVRWLAWHAFSNIGSAEHSRELDQIAYLSNVAAGVIENQRRHMRENAFTVEGPNGNVDVFVLPSGETRDRLLEHMHGQGWEARPSTGAEFSLRYMPAAELLYKGIVGVFENEQKAREAFEQIMEPQIFPFDISELFFSYALRALDVCLTGCADGTWGDLANAQYAEASAACAIGGGKFNWGVAADNRSELNARNASNKRWARLDPVKELAFSLRAKMPNSTRASAVRKILPQILEAARVAGEPLTGEDPRATVEGWFRKAGIK